MFYLHKLRRKVPLNDIAYGQVKDVHIGNSSNALVAYDNDEKDDIAGCTKYEGNCVLLLRNVLKTQHHICKILVVSVSDNVACTAVVSIILCITL